MKEYLRQCLALACVLEYLDANGGMMPTNICREVGQLINKPVIDIDVRRVKAEWHIGIWCAGSDDISLTLNV